jgi:hypothetical protein
LLLADSLFKTTRTSRFSRSSLVDTSIDQTAKNQKQSVKAALTIISKKSRQNGFNIAGA